MGLGSFPNDTFGAAGKKIGVGNASEPVRSGQYVDAMVCDQAAMISIPNIDSSTADVEGHGKERVDVAAPAPEKIKALLPPMLDLLDSRFQINNFTDFLRFLQKNSAEGDQNNFNAYRNFGVFDVVRYLEESNAGIAKAASQKLAELDAFYESEMAILTGIYQQQAIEIRALADGKIQELSSSLENVSKELSEARAEVSSMKRRLCTAESELQVRNKEFQTTQRLLDEEKTRNNGVITRLETSLKD